MTDEEMHIEMLNKHLNELGEHFDTVQIFCTRHEAETHKGTITVQKGIGNWYARYGQIATWMLVQDEDSRICARKHEDDQL